MLLAERGEIEAMEAGINAYYRCNLRFPMRRWSVHQKWSIDSIPLELPCRSWDWRLSIRRSKNPRSRSKEKGFQCFLPGRAPEQYQRALKMGTIVLFLSWIHDKFLFFWKRVLLSRGQWSSDYFTSCCLLTTHFGFLQRLRLAGKLRKWKRFPCIILNEGWT